MTNKDLKGNPLHRWLKFLDKKTSEEELKELSEMDQVIKTAEEKLEYFSSDAETLALYRAREAALHERANMISSAKEEGREAGLVEGRFEEKLQTARNMLGKGLAISLISEITGLTETEIYGLQVDLNNSNH